jgi:tetratricopeptide (TPR) repeat protein
MKGLPDRTPAAAGARRLQGVRLSGSRGNRHAGRASAAISSRQRARVDRRRRRSRRRGDGGLREDAEPAAARRAAGPVETGSGADAGPREPERGRRGFYLAEHKLDDEAAAAYRKGIANAGEEDGVAVSNMSEWLVNYEFEHGRKAQALRLAKSAAEVYSYRGLRTMGRLADRMSRFDEAESYFQKIAERYDGKLPLASFYYRRARLAGDTRYGAKLEPLLKEFLPAGVEATVKSR